MIESFFVIIMIDTTQLLQNCAFNLQKLSKHFTESADLVNERHLNNYKRRERGCSDSEAFFVRSEQKIRADWTPH